MRIGGSPRQNSPGTPPWTHDHPAPRRARPTTPSKSIIHEIPIVLPVVGGVLMFLLAFIAIYMA